MSRYLTDDEKALFEDLLNRVLDADESDASSGLALARKQAKRIIDYRAEFDKKSEDFRLEQERKKREAEFSVLTVNQREPV
jgi:hypothetical protein